MSEPLPPQRDGGLCRGFQGSKAGGSPLDIPSGADGLNGGGAFAVQGGGATA